MNIEQRLESIDKNLALLLAAVSAGALAAPAKGAPAAPKAPPAPGALDYDRDVKALVLKVAKEAPGKRETVIAINAKFGVESANKLKPEQWPAYIAACNEALTAKPEAPLA